MTRIWRKLRDHIRTNLEAASEAQARNGSLPLRLLPRPMIPTPKRQLKSSHRTEDHVVPESDASTHAAKLNCELHAVYVPRKDRCCFRLARARAGLSNR